MNHPRHNHHTNRHADTTGELIVDFPTRRRRHEDRQVRFATYSTVKHFASVLTVCSKQELWYSSEEIGIMKLQMKRDANALTRALLFPSSDKTLQVVGLDKVVSP